MNSLLSPDKLKEIEMRTSEHANLVRSVHPSFDMTEQEFRRISQVEREFGKNLQAGEMSASFEHLTKLEQQNIHEAGRAGSITPWFNQIPLDEPFQNALRDALGEQRYADYKMSQQPEYTFAYDVAQKFDLPKESARTVYEVVMDGYKRGEAIFNQKTLSPEARQSALNALKNEIQISTTRLLGEEGFKQYTSRGWFGTWLEHPSRKIKK